MSKQRSAYVKGLPGEKVRIDGCTIGKETEKAVLVTIEGKDHWFPLSQVHEIHRSKEKGGDSIVVGEWIAKQKGLR